MSIQSEIERIAENINVAFSAVGGKGGTVPASQISGNLAAAINSIPKGVTVQRTTGSFTTSTSGSASVNVGFKPDLVVFYTHTSYNRNVPMWASFPFEESGETKLAIAHAPTTKNYNSYVYAETECTQTSTGFSVYIRNLSQSLSFSNASRASFDYIAIKYTN